MNLATEQFVLSLIAFKTPPTSLSSKRSRRRARFRAALASTYRRETWARDIRIRGSHQHEGVSIESHVQNQWADRKFPETLWPITNDSTVTAQIIVDILIHWPPAIVYVIRAWSMQSRGLQDGQVD